MTKAPERVWVGGWSADYENGDASCYKPDPRIKRIEYIRADIHEELRELAKRLAKLAHDEGGMGGLNKEQFETLWREARAAKLLGEE